MRDRPCARYDVFAAPAPGGIGMELGHNYICDNYVGHNYMGHNFSDAFCRPCARYDVFAAPAPGGMGMELGGEMCEGGPTLLQVSIVPLISRMWPRMWPSMTKMQTWTWVSAGLPTVHGMLRGVHY